MRVVITRLVFLFILTISTVVIGAPVHPHLFFSREELPIIRKRVKRGTPKRAWFFMKERCKKHLLLKKLPSSNDLDNRLDPLSELGLAWQISENKRYKDKFLELLQAARKAGTDLEKLQYDTALIFDCGYDIMSEADREYLKKFLLEARKNQEKAYKVCWFPFSNWGLIPGMKGVREAAVLYGHPEYDPKLLDNAAELLRSIFCCFIHDSGFPAEGGNYFDYPFIRIGGASVFILKRKGYDFVKGTNLRKIPGYLLTAGIPGKKVPTYFPFGDSGYASPIPYTLRVLLNLMPDNNLLHCLATLGEIEYEHKPDPLSGMFYYVPVRNDLKSSISLKKSTFDPESGIVTYKSSMEPDAFFVASCTRQSRGHTHEDVGNFIIRAYCENWLTDPGYGEKSLLQHNMVAINNDSPHSSGSPGTIRQALLSPAAVIVHTDLTRFWNFYRPPGQASPLLPAPYPVQNAERTLVVIAENHGIPPYIILSDYVKRDERRHLYSQLFQLEPDKEIKLTGREAVLKKDDNQMRLEVIEPVEAKVNFDDWQTYGRFAGRKFCRVKAEVNGRYGRFVTVLYPRTKEMPEMKVQPARGAARWKIDWGKVGIDYLDFTTPELRKPYELLLWRVKAGEPMDAKPWEYIIARATKPVKQGNRGKRELASITACHTGRPIEGFIFSVTYGDGELHVDVYNHPFNERDIPQLVKIKAFGPGVRRIWMNGAECRFDASGDYVSVTGYSRLKNEYQRLAKRKWERLFHRQSEIRGYVPSPKISGEVK